MYNNQLFQPAITEFSTESLIKRCFTERKANNTFCSMFCYGYISVSSGILRLCAKNGRIYSKTMRLNKGVELLPFFMKINKSEAVNLLSVK